MGDAAALIGSDRGKYTSSKVAERIVNPLEDDQSIRLSRHNPSDPLLF
jgi:hypothetical protein